MAKLIDIATDVGVSVSLVSKVLNDNLGTTRVNPETVDKIRKTAKRLGYRSNKSALALLSGRHHAIGVFIHRAGADGSGQNNQLIDGISEEAGRLDQKLWLKFFNTPEEYKKLCAEIHPSIVDGLLIAGIYADYLIPELLKLRQLGLPIVRIHDFGDHAELPKVWGNRAENARLATAHLIEQGCRQIAFIRALMPASNSENSRIVGHRQALAQANLPYDEQLVYEVSNYTHTSGEEAVRHWLAQGSTFDGIVAPSDIHAVGAMHALSEAGIDVPQQVKIIGNDNSPYCSFNMLQLSSISHEIRQQAHTGVRMLIDLINDKPVHSTEIKKKLICRRSSAN